jgi:hypothetical protein
MIEAADLFQAEFSSHGTRQKHKHSQPNQNVSM